jgi:cell division septal protein FtsQ
MSRSVPKRRTASSRLRPFWMLFVVAAAAAAVGAYYGSTWPGFFPRKVAVSGNRIVPAGEILERAGIARDVNVWLQSMRRASARIETIPYIRTAYVQRALPAHVRIVVTERVPYAVVEFGRGRVLVDRDLRVLQLDDGGAAVPVFSTGLRAVPAIGSFLHEPQIVQLRDDRTLLASAHVAVSALAFDRFGGLVATMPDGLRLLLGDDADLQQKAGLIGPILSQAGEKGRRIAAVDLRAPRTPVVLYGP